MSKAHTLTQEDFNGLLEWLGQDREQAGDKYEAIRRRLIRIFISRGCHHAEEMADETINRVTFKLKEIRQDYVGDPALYFYGVANKVHLEYVRKNLRPSCRRPIRPTRLSRGTNVLKNVRRGNRPNSVNWCWNHNWKINGP